MSKTNITVTSQLQSCITRVSNNATAWVVIINLGISVENKLFVINICVRLVNKPNTRVKLEIIRKKKY